MPIQPTYPGVYVEEIPSGVRSITGVATSVTAFIGRAGRCPADTPVTINNFGDYERRFGGLHPDSMMSYAVRDFYQNGGSRAVIVRVAKGAVAATIELKSGAADKLVLEANSPGEWGKKLSATVDYVVSPEKQTSPTATVFNLTVRETGGATEKFLNVSSDSTNPRYVKRVLAETSALVTVKTEPAAKAWPDEGNSTLGAIAANDGTVPDAAAYKGKVSDKTGIQALLGTDFNLLCIPPAERDNNTDPTIYSDALALCGQKRTMLLVDPVADWGTSGDNATAKAVQKLADLTLAGSDAKNAALYFPPT